MQLKQSLEEKIQQQVSASNLILSFYCKKIPEKEWKIKNLKVSGESNKEQKSMVVENRKTVQKTMRPKLLLGEESMKSIHLQSDYSEKEKKTVNH